MKRRWITLTSVLLTGAAGFTNFAHLWGCSQGPVHLSMSACNSVAPGLGAVAKVLTVPGEEIWVIQKAEPVAPAPASDEPIPTSGELRAKLAGDKEVVVPLKHTAVNGSISAYIATVDVTQQFHNPYEQKIEAVYVFPLPENAAVNEFVMIIGDRRIRGIIREREEAQRVYAEARSQGYVASLLTQERPNVFTQSVANIEPGHEIDINIKYFHILAYDDGWYEFVFPMVVGPRFNPPGITDGIGAVARGAHGASGQRSEVQYLKPGERTSHDIGLELTIDAGVSIEQVRSVNHQIMVTHPDETRAVVRLDSADAIPNKDFVLRYKVAGDRIKTAVLTHRDERGGFFTVMVYPPEDLRELPRAPMEMIFVLDCSGSMSGNPIEQAKAAVARALDRMRPDDTFQIIRFSDNSSQFGKRPLPATAENLSKAKRNLKQLNGGGSTMMIEGIKAALSFPHDESRIRTVAFLTDGYIGNESEILAEVDRRLGPSRIFSFGVGTSPNRYLLDGLARIGRGAVAYLSLHDNAANVMDAYMDRVSHAALADVKVDWAGLAVTDVYPQRLPDLYLGRPVIATGRLMSTSPATIRVFGRAEGRELSIPIAVQPDDPHSSHAGLPAVWARNKIADCAYRSIMKPDGDWVGVIKEIALEYGLMSDYTAFVAVDSKQRTGGEFGISVAVPVPVPDGVRYDTTVIE